MPAGIDHSTVWTGAAGAVYSAARIGAAGAVYSTARSGSGRQRRRRRKHGDGGRERGGDNTAEEDAMAVAAGADKSRPCLLPKFFTKFHYAKRRFPITSKCRHIYEVLNVDEIKN
jgi:hypothetical protein